MECARVWGSRDAPSGCKMGVVGRLSATGEPYRRYPVVTAMCGRGARWTKTWACTSRSVSAVAHRPRSSLSLRDWRSSESCRRKPRENMEGGRAAVAAFVGGFFFFHGCLTFCVAATGVMGGNEKKGARWTFPCGVVGERVLCRQRWLERLCVCGGCHVLLLVSLTCAAACARRGCGSRRGSRGGPAAWP
jgi:hypothetical protein